MAINSKVRRDKRLPRLLAAVEAVEQPWQSCFCYLEESWVERKTRLCPHWGTVLGIPLGECDTGCHHPGFRTSHPVSSTGLCTALGHLPKSNTGQQHDPAKGSDMGASKEDMVSGTISPSYAYPEQAAERVYANVLPNPYLQQAKPR